MAPNKVENQIKEQLNAREIQPTEMAWDRLDSMLSVAEAKSAKRSPFFSFRFIGIAASFLVFLSIGILYFNQKSTEIKPENNVVVTEKESNSNINSNINSNDNGNDNSNNNEENVNGIKVESQVAQATNNEPSTISNEPQTVNNKSSKGFNQNQKTPINSINNKEKIIPFKSSEAVAQNEQPKQVTQEKVVNPKPTYVNVDDLLASVEKQPKTNTKVAAIKVDANSLLTEVDGELEQTFREKVISRIGKSYQNAKSALANRNQE